MKKLGFILGLLIVLPIAFVVIAIDAWKNFKDWEASDRALREVLKKKTP